LRISGIYVIHNRVTGGLYIGSAIDVLKRIRIHLDDLRKNKYKNTYLQRVWNKYREHDFEFCLIEKVKHRENLVEREQYWIDYYNPEYNIAPEAGSQLGYSHTVATRRRLRELAIRQMQDPKQRELQRAAKIGKIPWNKGLPMSEEQKIKLSKIVKKLMQDPKLIKKISKGNKRKWKDFEYRKKVIESFSKAPRTKEWGTAIGKGLRKAYREGRR
jgi:group I intron endonuclease